MSELNFKISLIGNSKNYITLMSEYEKFPTYLPQQLKSIKIIQKTSEYTITEENIFISSIIKKNIIQQTKHFNSNDNLVTSQIISGPANGSTLSISFDDQDDKTTVSVSLNIKLGLKYKLLMPIIKKSYKIFILGILYKMQNHIMGY